MSKSYEIKSEEKKNGSQIELLIEIKEAELQKERESAISELSKEVEVKGFRKGKVPADLVVKEIGEARIFERCAYRVINDTYLSLIESGKYQVITHPEISVTKLAPGNDLEFKIVLTVAPETILPDYKKIAKEVKKDESTEVTDKELDEHINRILENHARILNQTKHQHDHKDGKCEDCEKEGEEKKEELPKLDDELVKKFGDFKDVDDFKTKLRESLQEEKKSQSQQKRRTEIIEKIIKETKVDVPEILVDAELDRMMAQLEADVSRMGLQKDQYLQAINKKEDEIKNEWRDDAKKRAVMNLVLPDIAKQENISPDKEEMENEISKIKEQVKDQKIDDLQLKVYVASVMTNEKVFEFLENL